MLLGLGVRPGESKVVWCGQNSIGLVVMINAARKLGVTAVPLNYRLSDEEAAYVTDHCDATIVYVTRRYTPMFGARSNLSCRRSSTCSCSMRTAATVVYRRA